MARAKAAVPPGWKSPILSVEPTKMDDIARELSSQVIAQLPRLLHQLLQQQGHASNRRPLRLLCDLASDDGGSPEEPTTRLPVASVDIGSDFVPILSAATPAPDWILQTPAHSASPISHNNAISPAWDCRTSQAQRPSDAPPVDQGRPNRHRKQDSLVASVSEPSPASSLTWQGEDRRRVQKRKRTPDNPALQPSSLEKLINGIWDSLFSGVRMDPTEIIEQWQSIESSGQPRLLTDADQDLACLNGSGAFARMNRLTRKISHTTRTCRSLEVIVQAQWIQCFDERVAELAQTLALDKAKKKTMSEACIDFSWSEKELRNKMAIWRGYYDIKTLAGWVGLVFAGAGLYRFSKYRVCFSDETKCRLTALRQRFEVAADTLHPRWRTLLGIIGASTEPKYKGHPHDWVVNGPGDEALPLRQTYLQWDRNFSYVHLDHSTVDENAWGDFDPRTVHSEAAATTSFTCDLCGERQSGDPMENACACYPTLYGSLKASVTPVQVYRTPNGKNNGLLACCSFEKGSAVGEFVGEITSGIKGLDVMIDRTDLAQYQIWQGRTGNYTRFVNHSCAPNSHYERFVWLGKARSVLVSDGIEAEQEITVDYGHTYWEDLVKECLCNSVRCRYRGRQVQQLLTPANGAGE